MLFTSRKSLEENQNMLKMAKYIKMTIACYSRRKNFRIMCYSVVIRRDCFQHSTHTSIFRWRYMFVDILQCFHQLFWMSFLLLMSIFPLWFEVLSPCFYVVFWFFVYVVVRCSFFVLLFSVLYFKQRFSATKVHSTNKQIFLENLISIEALSKPSDCTVSA